MATSIGRSRDVQRSRNESVVPHPTASFRDTLVLLLTIGAIVVVCGVASVAVLHPMSGHVIVERLLAIIARR